jgi:hypothetical protein
MSLAGLRSNCVFGYVDFFYGSGLQRDWNWVLRMWICLSLDGFVFHRIWIGLSMDGWSFFGWIGLSLDGIRIGSKNGYDQGFLRILCWSFNGLDRFFSGFSSCFSSDRIHILVSTKGESVTGKFRFFKNNHKILIINYLRFLY